MNRLSIRIKLVLLAGVPVLGALVLAGIIAVGVRRQAEAAGALGSFDDVAQLTAHMSVARRALQLERANVALREGVAARPGADPGVRNKAAPALAQQYTGTDAALDSLDQFLDGRALSRLPPRLARGLSVARERLARRKEFRERLRTNGAQLDDILAFYAETTEALLDATAALTELSDDGKLLRPISSLVALGELTERESLEHALLAYVFASTQFPPGSYKTLVTVATEQSIYENAFRSNAADAIVREYDAAEASSDATAAIAMSAKALATTDEILDFDVREWFERESGRLARQYAIEDEILAAVASAASAKMEAARTSTRTSFALSSFVLLASALLAWTIGRGVIRTVIALSSAAALVRRTKDYSIRAPKTSADELGALTDAFNEMLSDIQGRDKELQVHRDNLESTVASRTAELVSRTAAMRLVLDNVDQGLATIRRDGKLDSERSAAFDRLFGRPVDGIGFAEHLGAADETLAQRLKIGWEQVVDAWLPIEVAIEQLPQHIVCEGTHVTLGYRPIQRDGLLDGVLLVASDVTAEHAAREGQERQREYIATFERITRDRDGFVEFFTEIARLLKRLADGSADPIERMRIAHTIKGNAAQWGVSSVAKIAHELESKLVAGDGATEHDFQQLFDTWEAVRIRYTPLLGDEGVRLTITSAEMDGVLSEIQARVPHDELLRRIERLRHEPTGTRFERMAADLHRLADRLNKPMPKVVVDANDVRLPASRFSPFWQATVHVLRNIMDHGIETAEERAAAGKPEAGTVTLRSVATGDQFRIEFSDDGRGIDWGKIASKALEAGLPAERHADLERALFAPGISTAAAVTDLSGRGVGLSSVEACCKALGGFATVTSELGKGTRFSFVFPRKPNENSIRPEARSLN